jgi:hypothetical protein
VGQALVTGLLALLLLAAAAGLARALQADRVVVLVVDGPRGTEFLEDPSHAHAPHIWNELAPQGYVSHAFSNEGLTTTIPGHAAIASGVHQSLPNNGSQRSFFPLIWEYLRDQTGLPDEKAVLVAVKAKMAILSYSRHPDYGPEDSARVVAPLPDDPSCLQAFLDYAEVHEPVFAMVMLGEVDLTAHGGDWEGYLTALETADSLAAALWSWIESHPFYAGRTEFFIVSDHGRHTYDFTDHGDGCAGCRRLPFVALGPDVRAGVETDSVAADQRDLCTTIGAILGLQTPLSQGRIMGEIFEGPAGASAPWRNQGLLLRTYPIPADEWSTVVLEGEAGTTLWDAMLVDVGGRRIWEGRIPGSALRKGYRLQRPPALASRCVTLLRLEDPRGPRALSARLLWSR